MYIQPIECWYTVPVDGERLSSLSEWGDEDGVSILVVVDPAGSNSVVFVSCSPVLVLHAVRDVLAPSLRTVRLMEPSRSLVTKTMNLRMMEPERMRMRMDLAF